MTALEDLRPPGGWRTAADVDATSDRPLRTNLTLAAECFDCGGELAIVRCDRFNGGKQLRATVDCTDSCGRRWTIDVSLTGHPKPGPRPPVRTRAAVAPPTPPAPPPAPEPAAEPANVTDVSDTAPAARRHRRMFPAAPVIARLGDEPDAEIAARFGVDRRTIQRWRHGHSHLSASLADRVALEMGVHPSNLWPDQWEAA